MAKGNELGDYTLRLITVTVKPGLSGSVVLEGNWEGIATGYGTILSTSLMVGAGSGTYTFYSAVYLDTGERLTGTATGTYDTIGKHIWQTDAILRLSDGDSIATEGTIDLAGRTWKGKFFEIV